MTVNWHHSMDKNSNKTKTPAITLSPLDITSATSTPTQITKFTFETLNPSKSTSKSPKLQIKVGVSIFLILLTEGDLSGKFSIF